MNTELALILLFVLSCAGLGLAYYLIGGMFE